MTEHKIVRRMFVIPVPRERITNSFRDNINFKIQATKNEALQVAAQIGMENLDINESFDLHTIQAFTEYPMYLLGENAPRPKNWEEWLGIGPCRYTVVIREKE